MSRKLHLLPPVATPLPRCAPCLLRVHFSDPPPSSLFVVTASGLEGPHRLPDDAYRTFHRDFQKCVFVIGIELGGTFFFVLK